MKRAIKIVIPLLLLSSLTPLQAVENNESYSDGKSVSGSVEGKEVVLNDNLKGTMVATNQDLTLVDQDFAVSINHPIENFIVVNDVDNDGTNDIAVSLNTDDGYNNLMVISSLSGNILYENSFNHITGDNYGNKINSNSTIRTMLYNEKKLYVIYDYHLVCIDLEKNKIVFDKKEKDNIWKAEIDDDQLFIVNQLGELVSFNVDDGKEIYRKKLAGRIKITNSYDENNKIDTQLNLWDIVVSNDNLYVSSEDGNLFQINKSDGSLINELELGVESEKELKKRLSKQFYFDYSTQKMNITTGLVTRGYKSYKLKLVRDDLLLVEAYLGDKGYQSGSEIDNSKKGLKPTLLLINLNDFSINTKIDLDQYNLDCSNTVISNYQGQEVLIIPGNINKEVLKIFIYSLADGKLLMQNDLKGLSFSEDNKKLTFDYLNGHYYLQIDGGNSYRLSDDLKSFEYLGSSNLVNLINDLGDSLLVSNSQNNKIISISKLGLNGKSDILMNVVAPSGYLNNGFETIVYDKNTGHILTLVNEVNSSNVVVSSHIVIIDGNGNILNDKKVLVEKGVDENNKTYEHYLIGDDISYFNDINNDGKNEILVNDTVVNGASFSLLTSYGLSVEDSGTVVEVGDVNGDGISDIVSVGETQMVLYNSNKSSEGITYQKSNISKRYDKNLKNNSSVKSLGDLQHNGVKPFVINAINKEGCQYYQVINPKDLSVRFNLMESGVFDWGESFKVSDDYNNDGCDDIMFAGPSGKYQVLNGKDGKTLIDVNQYEDNSSEDTPTPLEDIIPINLELETSFIYQLEDINGDGIKEFGYSFYSNDGQCIRIIDGSNYEIIKDCKLDIEQDITDTFVPVQGQSKIIIIGYNINYIFDYQNDILVAGFTGNISKAKALNDGRILLIDASNQLKAFSDQSDFSLVDFNKINFNKSKIKVKYESDVNGIMTVYDRGVKIVSTTANEIDLQLLEGKHTLLFSLNDGAGKVTNITKEVIVKKSSGLRYLMILIGILMILFGSILVGYPKYHLYKKAGIKHD